MRLSAAPAAAPVAVPMRQRGAAATGAGAAPEASPVTAARRGVQHAAKSEVRGAPLQAPRAAAQPWRLSPGAGSCGCEAMHRAAPAPAWRRGRWGGAQVAAVSKARWRGALWRAPTLWRPALPQASSSPGGGAVGVEGTTRRTEARASLARLRLWYERPERTRARARGYTQKRTASRKLASPIPLQRSAGKASQPLVLLLLLHL